MDEQPQQKKKPDEIADQLSATKPVAGELFRRQLEERLVSRLHAGHPYPAQDAREQTSGAASERVVSAPKRTVAPSPVPTFRVGFGSRVGRVTSVAMGVVGVALLALLFVGMSALLQARQSRGIMPVDPSGTGQPSVTPTPAGIDIGGAYMLDPQGDVELARRVIETVVESGTPQVVLSRRVIGGELPCVGFEWQHSHEMRPTDSFGLVVLKGTFRRLAPGEPKPPAPDGSSESYSQFLYDERYPGPGITAQGTPGWGALRGTFGGPGWPKDSQMYLSPDGQPGLAEIEQYLQSPLYRDLKVTDLKVAQTLSGWTVTVARVYALGDTIFVGYTIVGPHPRDRFEVENPSLEVAGANIVGLGSKGQSEPMGPMVSLAGFRGLPTSEQSQEVRVRFVVPAIHIRPTRYPCEMPGLKPEDYPTPTRIPNDPPVGDTGATPAPDLETVGPFTLDLKVVVEPMPTQPALPPPPQPSLAVPDIPPVPTAPGPPDATQAAIASMTVIPVPTQVPGLEATRVAQATAFPYPTAEPPTVQVGRPSIATTKRGDLSIELRLDDNTYLAGENGQALITLRNDGQESLYVASRRLELVDETARTVSSPWPLPPWMPDGWPGWDRGPMGQSEIAPGGVMSETFTFQVPPIEEAQGHAYHLTAWVYFSRSSPDGRGSDGIMIDLQGEPLPIVVTEPEPRQHLKADLRMDRQGWTLRVTDGDGGALTGPFWGGWEARYNMGGTSSALPEPSQAGGGTEPVSWSVPWHEGSADIIRGGSEVTMQVWVAARGYVPAVITQTLPSTQPAGDPGGMDTPTPIRSIPPMPTAPTGSSDAPTPTTALDFPALARGYWEANPRSTPLWVQPGGIAFRPWYAVDFTPDGAATVTWDNGLTCTTSPATVAGNAIWVTTGDVEAEFTIHAVDGAWVRFRQGGQEGTLKLRKTRDDPRVACY